VAQLAMLETSANQGREELKVTSKEMADLDKMDLGKDNYSSENASNLSVSNM
jgi:hypothetical protein